MVLNKDRKWWQNKGGNRECDGENEKVLDDDDNIGITESAGTDGTVAGSKGGRIDEYDAFSDCDLGGNECPLMVSVDWLESFLLCLLLLEKKWDFDWQWLVMALEMKQGRGDDVKRAILTGDFFADFILKKC